MTDNISVNDIIVNGGYGSLLKGLDHEAIRKVLIPYYKAFGMTMETICSMDKIDPEAREYMKSVWDEVKPAW